MFVFLSKKIAIPNGVNLHSIAWNSSQGWISCGGDSGLLKVLKMETNADSNAKGIAAPTNLTMNQTLEGHQGAVVCCTWNSTYRKLTTSDQNGMIIVWMLHRGMWFEEMINNRNKSVVKDMKWTPDGQKICIAYADGAVIVGGVDGNRLWAKELGMELCQVEWSPDGRHILFGDSEGSVFMFDNQGNQLAKVPLYANSDETGSDLLIGVEWYDGSKGKVDTGAPDLAIAFSSGQVQITNGVHLKLVVEGEEVKDSPPVLIDTGMTLCTSKWNCNGTILALAGYQETENRKVNMVQFYSPYGQHLRTLKVPGNSISSLAWDGSGLRIAIAVDSHIYFASIRLDYKWGFFGNSTLCYAFNKSDRPDAIVVFWDMLLDERRTKYIKRLLAVKAAGENCVLVSRGEGFHLKSDQYQGFINQYTLLLCNSIGSPVDNKIISVDPQFIAMTKSHVVVANRTAVYVWQFKSGVSKLGNKENNMAMLLDPGGRSKNGRERIFHIDNDPSRHCATVQGYVDNKTSKKQDSKQDSSKNLLIEALLRPTSDAITCIAASDKCVLIGRESGTLQRYTLPHISLECKYVVQCRPQRLELNCTSTKVGIIDINGVMTILDLEKKSENGGAMLPFERKDTWDILWAKDNEEMIAVMEKTKLYLFRGIEPEEPVLSSGYLARHDDLQIMAVMMDEIMQHPMTPSKDMVLDFPTKSLRDTRAILKDCGVDEALAFIENHQHPRLWRLLAQVALERLEFNVADKAFVRCGDYPGIQFVKNVKLLNDKVKQKAQVASYFERFDQAEALYRDIDRKDLAIDLRIMLGDWFRVVQLVQTGGGGGDDELLKRAWKEIGDYYASRQKWNKAVQYHASAKEAAALVECYYILGEYECLEKLIRVVSEGSPLLRNIGNKFQSVGLSDAACSAFLKAGDVKAAIDCCVLLNHWESAIELAQEHQFPQIEGLLAKYASHLLEKGEKLQAIELYRKAKKSTQAATLLASLAHEAGKSKVNPLGAKKLHVLAAMEMEELRTRVLDTQIKTLNSTVANTDEDDYDASFSVRKPKTIKAMTAAQATAATLDGLMEHDMATGENRNLDNAWRGAEAWHLFMLAQRQMYNSDLESAFLTSLQLRPYDDIMDPKDVHALIALTSFYVKAWGQCSKAFIELEALRKNDQTKFSRLALDIFMDNRPVDPPELARLAAAVENGIGICMASGRPLEDRNKSSVYKCRRCSRKMYEDHLRGRNHCPLCHMMLL